MTNFGNINMFAKAFITTMLCVLIAQSGFAQRETRAQVKAREMEIRGDHYAAIKMYERDLKSSKRKRISQMGIARNYELLKEYNTAAHWYSQLMEQYPSMTYVYRQPYVEMLIGGGRYEEAKQIMDEISPDSIAPFRKLLAVCDSATLWKAKEPNFEVGNVTSLNTCYSDWGAILFEEEILFSSDRPEKDPRCTDDITSKEYMFLSIFSAKPEEKDSLLVTKWKDIQPMPYPINTGYAHTGPAYFTVADSNRIYYTQSSPSKGKKSKVELGREERTFFKGNLEIYSTTRKSDWWTTPEKLNVSNPEQYSVGHACISPDGKTLYFASDRPGGFGGVDLWYCDRMDNGSWGTPANMGKEINTSGDEMFPTMGLDGTLYFSSNGHAGMGGLDIFKATGKGAKWSPVENMKYPINSGGDDFYLIAVDSTNSRGYFSSNRMGGKGSDDIYAFIPVEKQEPVAPTPPPPIVEPVKPPVKITPKEDEPVEVKGVLLAGKVFDSKTKMPLPGAKICATHDNTKTSVCKEVRDDGNFTFTLRPNTRYTLSGFKEGYLSTEPLKLASSSIIEGQELPVEMQEKTKTSFRSTQQVVDRYTPKAAKPSVRRNQREYRIQVLALQNDADIDWEYFEKLRRTYPQFEVVYTQRAKTKRYTYGTFTNIAEARRYLQRYINLGYPDSFIAVFVNNRQVESIYSSGKRDRIR